ncbi:16764_t:CDS:2, partial [Racocetra fulgida]
MANLTVKRLKERKDATNVPTFDFDNKIMTRKLLINDICNKSDIKKKLLLEISNQGVPPFNESFDIPHVLKVIIGSRELPINGTPLKYVDIYEKCWDENPDKRPSCLEILEEMREISYKEVYIRDQAQEQNYVPVPESEHVPLRHLLDFKWLEKEAKRKRLFVKRFGLTKGRNRNGFDFAPGKKHILDGNGRLDAKKLEHFKPIVYLANINIEPWAFLNKFALFPRKDTTTVPYGVDIIRIHIPIGEVEYEGHLTDEFIHEIKDALDISNIVEKRSKLSEIFNEYGNYVITKFTLGGAIMINTQDIKEEESLLRFQVYLNWGISFAKGETQAIFENGTLKGFPRFETFPSRSMENVSDLYRWLKDLHECKDVEIIKFKQYIPFYELLDNNLKEKIFECFALTPIDEPLPILIPQLPSEFKQETFSKWTSLSNSSLLPYVRDWIEELSLRYGVLLQHSKLQHGKTVAFKFLKEPEISSINKLIILLAQPKNQQEAYLLDNGIDLEMADELNISETPFIDFNSSLNRPVEDLKNSKKKSSKRVFCQIIFQAARLSFVLPYVKPSEPYIEAVDVAIDSCQPYKNLSELFNNDFGHLLPKTVVIGGILKRSYESYKINPIDDILKIEFDDNTSQEEIENRLAELSKEYNIDTSLFLSRDGKVIDQNQIIDWLKFLKNDPENWKIVSLEDWVPSYKVLAYNDVEIILDDKYHIVFEGEIFLTQDNQSSIIVNFPGALSENDFQIYGEIVKSVKSDIGERWETIPEYRDIKVICGECDVEDIQSDIRVVLKTDDEICTDNVLVTTFVTKPFKDLSCYKIVLKSWAKNTFILGIQKGQENSQYLPGQISDEDLEGSSDDAKEESIENNVEPNLQEKISINFCIINTDKEVNKVYKWSIYGINFDDELKDEEINCDDFNPNFSPMKLEDAIAQHQKPNGNTLDAWKSFVKIRNDTGDPRATYWIGHYLENNKKILGASIQFYEDVLEGTKDLQQAAMRYYKEAADYGDSNGQLSYGHGLFLGNGVLEDKREARRYFELSSKNGNIDAMYNLGGILYTDGNTERGESLLVQAAQKGHIPSIRF